MNITRLIFSSLVFFLFACGNSQQNNPTINAVVKTDSIKTLDSIKVENNQTVSFGKPMDALLKSGKKGIFEDSTFSAIIENDFAVGISNPAPNRYDVDEFTYNVTSYKKEGVRWKIESEKTVISDFNNYKPNGSDVKIIDIDGDGKKDIMLLFASDGRGNEHYNLFLVKNKKLAGLKGFKDLPAPVYDVKKKMIASTSSYHGGRTVEYYKIVRDSVVFVEGFDYLYGKDGVKLGGKFTKKED